MVRCDMCGMEVPVGPNGTCFLGHRLPDAAAASAPVTAPQVVSPVQDAPQPPVAAGISPPPADVVAPFAVAPVADGPPAFATSISPDLIAAAVAEVETPEPEAPAAFTPPRPLGAPAEPAAFTPPRPLGAPAEPAAFTPPRPLGAPAEPAVPAGPAVPVTPAAFTPPRPLGEAPSAPAVEAAPQPVSFVPPASPPADYSIAPNGPATPFRAASLPTTGNVALAEALPISDAAAILPSTDMFVVNSPAAPKSKLVVLIALGVALIVVAAGLKTFVFKSEPQLAGLDSAPVQRQPETLVRAFSVGESHRYEVRATITTTISGEGESMDNEAAVEAVLTEAILSRTKDGTTTARYSLDRMKMTVDGETMAVPHSPGAGVVVTMDKRGRVIDVKHDASGPMQADLSFHEMFVPVLPPGAGTGDRWTRVDELSIPGFPEPVKATSRFHLKSVKNGKGSLESSSEVPVNLTIPMAEVGELFGDAAGGEVTVRGRFLGKGRQTVDLASGRSLSASGDMAVTLAFFQGDTQMARMSMKINVTVREVGGVSSTAA